MTPRRAALICGLLLAVFGGVSYSSVLTKSPTWDEPGQALGDWVTARFGDYRMNFEDPPILHFWSALANGRDALHVDFNSPTWAKVGNSSVSLFNFAMITLYRTPGNHADVFINRARAMMVLLGLALGVLIAFWSWRLGGGAAAVIATLLFAFDPGFLGHAAVVKTDIAMTLVSLALIFAVWQLGRRITVWNAVASGLLCGVVITTKFSGLLLGPVVAVLLVGRALSGETWETAWRPIESPGRRLGIAALLLVAMLLTSVGVTWAVYRFRFSASATPGYSIDTARLVDDAISNRIGATHPGLAPTAEELQAARADGLTRGILWALHHRVLPEAWLNGILHVHGHSLLRGTFFLNEVSGGGPWYYFPVAFLVKEPVATLVGLLGAAAAGLWFVIRRGRGPGSLWTPACLILPPVIYSASAVTAHLTIGIRHLFPVFPYLFIGAGLAGAAAWHQWPRWSRAFVAVCALGLVAESLAAAPDYLAFFNRAVGGSRGGIRLLGDSNLDWGQDLPALAAWQAAHPADQLYLAYFGIVSPEAYDIRYRGMPGNAFLSKPAEPLQGPAVVAISATQLQGIYLDNDLQRFYQPFRSATPLEVLGGSIYLYRWPLDGR